MKDMSSTYVSVIVMVLAQVLPKLGITVGSDSLTTTITTLVTVVAALKVLYERYKHGDITVFGSYKQ